MNFAGKTTLSQYVPLRAKQATFEHCAIFSGAVTILAGYAKKKPLCSRMEFYFAHRQRCKYLRNFATTSTDVNGNCENKISFNAMIPMSRNFGRFV